MFSECMGLLRVALNALTYCDIQMLLDFLLSPSHG